MKKKKENLNDEKKEKEENLNKEKKEKEENANEEKGKNEKKGNNVQFLYFVPFCVSGITDKKNKQNN